MLTCTLKGKPFGRGISLHPLKIERLTYLEKLLLFWWVKCLKNGKFKKDFRLKNGNFAGRFFEESVVEWYRQKQTERVVLLEQTYKKPVAGEVLQELRSVGLCRATDCLHIVNGKVELRPEVLEEDKGAGILSLEYTEKGWKVKFCDKLKALELLGDHLGLFREHTVRETENCNLLEAILDGTGEDLEVDDLSELQ